jgi:hypothetical protein
MTNETGESGRKKPLHVKDSRQDRLKLALRENLKRRKVQARERGKTTDPLTDDEASLDVQVGKRGEEL